MELNQRTYLADSLHKALGGNYDHYWDLTTVITDKQRGFLLHLYFAKKYEELKTAVEDITNFQLRKEQNVKTIQ